MHVKIAWDIYQDKKQQKGQQQKLQQQKKDASSSGKTSNHHYHRSAKSSKTSSTSSSSHSSPLPNVAAPNATILDKQQQPPPIPNINKNSDPGAPPHSHSTAVPTDPVLMSISNYTTTTIKAHDPYNGLTTLTRSQSVTTITQQYPSRFGSSFGTASLSAPPNFPALFPPPTPNPSMTPINPFEIWSRPPIYRPNTLLPSADYYHAMNSTPSPINAWAALPPRPPLNHEPSISSLNTNPNNTNNRANCETTKKSSSHKRKHNDADNGKDRALNKHNSYPNGDICRNEQSNNKSKSSKQARIENGYNSTANVYNIGDNAQSNPTSDLFLNSLIPPASQIFGPPPPTPAAYNPLHAAAAAAAAAAASAADQQRYLELLNAAAASSASSSPATSFPPASPAASLLPGCSSTDPSLQPPTSSKSALWPPPISIANSQTHSGQPSSSSSSMMMPDPFKSLQDISLRAGLVNQDRENVFSRFNLLNSSGGGASILEKLNKEQMEKLEMMQMNQNANSKHETTNKSSSNRNNVAYHLASSSTMSSNLPTASQTSSITVSSAPSVSSTPYGTVTHPSYPHQSYLNSLYIPPPPLFGTNAYPNGSTAAAALAVTGQNNETVAGSSSPAAYVHHQFMYSNPFVASGSPAMANFMKAASTSATFLDSATKGNPSGVHNFPTSR